MSDRSTELETSLSSLATEIEDLSLRIHDFHPRQAQLFQKFAAHCRHCAQCLRTYKALPDPKPAPPLVSAAKTLTEIQRQVHRVQQMFPKR